MLALTRRLNEQIVIGTGKDTVVIEVMEIRGNQVTLSFDAPKHISVDRVEVRLMKEAERLNGEAKRHG